MAGYLALRPVDGNASGSSSGGDNTQSPSEGSGMLRQSEDGQGLLPRDELLAAIKVGSVIRLSHVLKHCGQDDLDHLYGHPESASPLHLATLNNWADGVAMLLEAGASPNSRDLRGKKYTSLHYASLNGQAKILQNLLEKGADINAKEGDFGRTPLHLLTLRWKTAEDDFGACLDNLLRQNKIKIDSPDSSGATALFLAAQKEWEYMTRHLILKGASIETKVGSKTAADVINKKLPGLLATIDFSTISKARRFYGDELYSTVKEEDIHLFRDIMKEINEKDSSSKTTILEEDHGEYTLLNYACSHGLHEFVEELLQEGADATHVDQTSRLSPILYAAKNGYYRVLEALTEHMKKMGILKKGALKSADRKGETALHKVVKREKPADAEWVDYLRCLQILINLKGHLNIDAQDDFNNTPLHYAVLCDDQSFVRTLLINGAHLGIENKFGTLAITRIQPTVLESVLNDCIRHKNNVADRDFEIILQYSMLAPPSVNDQKPETECLRFLSGSKPHRHLLLHPIIDTFLYLKWQRVRQYYFINLFAYTAFLVLLTAYILIYFGAASLPFSSQPPEAASVDASATEGTEQSAEDKSQGSDVVGIILKTLIMIFWLYGALREGVQLLVGWRNYVKSMENWLELAILVMSFLVLFVPLPYVSMQGLSAWLVLCSWIELVLILGRHPLFAVYITMFTTVTFNFLKLIIVFSFMIVAFTLSFFLVYRMNEHFVTYPKTLLKTIAMSTGEIEYTDLPLTDFPVSSHLLFVIFVFLIVLVLMNLLNGLAVSDIAIIQKEAEIVSFISRVELISYIESVFLANPFKQMCSRICDEENCCFRACQKTNPLIRFLNYLGKRTLMFRRCLVNHQVTVYPNRGDVRWHVCSCHSFSLEENQIEAAKSVVLSEESKVSDRLEGLESRVDSVMAAIKSLSDTIRGNGIRLNVGQ